ncbi:MAG: S-layer homology domain-containing protein [Defluviitaleaceae bacterium]|nr:S-layer homology domain-containing protein [Defluviitaleaceae bacterium]
MKIKINSVIAIFLAIVITLSSLSMIPIHAQTDDITGTFFETEFRAAINRGWLRGFPDGTFRPDANITRAEFITVLDNVLQLPAASTTSRFYDVEGGVWFFDTLLKFQPYINPRENNTFQAGNPITREEVSFIMYGLIGTDIHPVNTAFADSQAISPWAYDAVNALRELEILRGNPDGTFAPARNITRAEAVLIVYRFYNAIETGQVDLTDGTVRPTTENNRPPTGNDRYLTLDDIRDASGDDFEVSDRGDGRPPSIVIGYLPQVEVFTLEDAIYAMHVARYVFDIGNAFEELVPNVVRRAFQHHQFHLSQVYQGIPVIGAGINLGADRDTGAVLTISSSYRPDVRRAITTVEPTLSAEEAIQALIDLDARYRHEFNDEEWYEFVTTRNVRTSVVILTHVGTTPRLAWRLSVGFRYYFDAHTGELLDIQSGIRWANSVSASGIGSFGDTREFNVTQVLGVTPELNRYYMHDYDRGIRTYQTTALGYQRVSDIQYHLLKYGPGDIVSNLTSHWASNPAAVDAHYQASRFYYFLLNTVERENEDEDDRLSPLHVSVGLDVDNAFWVQVDGASELDVSFAIFGTNDDVSLVAALDVFGHEFGHGIAHFHQLSGPSPHVDTLHEAYADIIGKLFELYVLEDVESWVIGHSIGLDDYYLPRNSRGDNPSRDLHAPARFGNPTQFGGTHFIFQPPLRNGVYFPRHDIPGHNSTIISHIFYRIYTCDYIPSISCVNTAMQLWYVSLSLASSSSDLFDTRVTVLRSARSMGVPFEEIARMGEIFDDALLIIERRIVDRRYSTGVLMSVNVYVPPDTPVNEYGDVPIRINFEGQARIVPLGEHCSFARIGAGAVGYVHADVYEVWFDEDLGQTRTTRRHEFVFSYRDPEPWSEWYITHLTDALNLGILRGHPNRRVDPLNTMTVGEFVYMTHNALFHNAPRVDRSANLGFAPPETWWNHSFATNQLIYAYQNDWLTAFHDPNAPITRQQAMRVLWYAYTGMDDDLRQFFRMNQPTRGLESEANRFEDISQEAMGDDYALYHDYVLKLSYNGIVNGFRVHEGVYTFRPNDTLLRAQAATIIMRLYNSIGGFNDNDNESVR